MVSKLDCFWISMQALNREELAKFLQALAADDDIYRLLAVLSLTKACRVSEFTGRWAIKRANKQKIKYFHKGLLASEVRDGYIKFRRLKGSKNVDLPIERNANPLFDEWESLHKLALITPPNQELFQMSRTTVWRHFQQGARKAGIKLSGASVRGMKHTWATLTAPSMTVREQQKVSGHVKVDSLMQYHDVSVEQAAARSKAALAL